MKNIIEIKNLKKYFKEVKAVDDISFNVKEGEFLAFLGLNGAGKSTTINIICNTLEKDSGEVFIDGLSIDKNMKEIKPKIGVVFQQSVLDSKLTALDNLKVRASLYGLTEEQFKNNLEMLSSRLEFKDILKRPLNKLSGGQKRRIDIARALIHNPKILILDEPTTGLDPKTRILVWDLINDLIKKQNLTILLTTHYMEETTDADNVVIIDNGKIVANDSPINLKEKYAFDFLKIYKFNKNLPELLKVKNIEFTTTKGVIEIVIKSTETAKQIIKDFGEHIYDFEVIKGKMDNVFLNVTGKNIKEVI